jgi:hypothetical protein
VEAAGLLLGDQRTELDLVDLGSDARLGDQTLDVSRLEVRSSDRPNASIVTKLYQPAPSIDVAVLPRHRPVDEVLVDVVEPEPFEALLQLARDVEPRGHQLRRDEHLVAREPAAGEAGADAPLVLVEGGGVDVPVAGLECPLDRLLRLAPVRDLPDAEPEHRHADAARELSIRLIVDHSPNSAG